MTTQEIIEGNKLIAEFMGGNLTDYPEKGMFPGEKGYQFPNPVYLYRKSPTWWNVNAMKYHTSWDWLMPVVEKVEKGFIVCIWFDCCEVSAEERKMTYPPMLQRRAETKTLATWNAVIQFIKWDNNQNK